VKAACIKTEFYVVALAVILCFRWIDSLDSWILYCYKL